MRPCCERSSLGNAISSAISPDNNFTYRITPITFGNHNLASLDDLINNISEIISQKHVTIWFERTLPYNDGWGDSISSRTKSAEDVSFNLIDRLHLSILRYNLSKLEWEEQEPL